MTLKRRLAIGLLVAVIFSLTRYAVAHADVPQQPIDQQAAVMYVMTFLIVVHRLFF